MGKKILNIGVIVAGIDEEYQHNIIEGINSFAKENNANLYYFAAFGGILGNTNYDKGEYNIFNLVNYKKFDGIIFLNNTISSPEVKMEVIKNVTSANLPTVVFDYSENPDFYNIAIDNFKAMEDIVNHIVEVHNATKINYVSGPVENPESYQRYQAYLSVLEAHNIPFDEKRVYWGEFRAIDGREAAETFINSDVEFPEAIICANDAMALSLVNILEHHGIKVPDDVLVTGFDNIYMARNFSPEITTVNRPLHALGYKACDIISRIYQNEEVPKKHVVFTNPIFSESCGCVQNSTQKSIQELKKDNYAMVENCNYHISIINRMNSELADSESLNNIVKIVNQYLDELNCSNFYLCLCENWKGLYTQSNDISGECTTIEEYCIEGYTQKMNVALYRKNRQIIECENFNTEDMIPHDFTDGGNISYFFPIHFRERCLGYCIIVNNDFPISNLLFHTWVMNISNALENVRKLSLLNSAISKLDKLYVIDPLCEIYNRNGFIRTAGSIFNHCIQSKKSIMVMFVDMDGLKIINDTYSHKEGDFALKTLASILNDCCEEGEICSRFGGDEFIIFASDYDEERAIKLTQKIQNKMNQTNEIIDKPYKVSASTGYHITVATEDLQLFSVVTMADHKMYEEKKRKKTSRYLRRT